MHIQGFECNQCQFNFEAAVPNDSEVTIEIRCPQCDSTDVRQSDAASEFLELIREIGSTGG